MNEPRLAASDSELASFQTARKEKFGALDRFLRSRTFERLRNVDRGRLTMTDAIGSEVFGSTDESCGLEVTLTINDPTAYSDIVFGGSIGAAEAYMAGKFRVSDLTTLVRLLLLNRHVLEELDQRSSSIVKPLRRIAHWHHRNTHRKSRKNIHAHYDLGDDFFRQFLDPTMTYSSAVYPQSESSLDEAASYKLDLICRKLELSKDDHLLEIGTGWGGLAIHAAREYGCRVTTTTISKNQFEVATERVRAAGLEDHVTVLDRDYRDLEGRYNKLVSVEMIEAVGLKYLDTFFRVCREHLEPGGRMLLQAIVLADRYFDRPRRRVDFIQKYIFPGGALPSMSAITKSIAGNTDLQMVDLHDISLHYAKTLRDWRRRFFERLGEIRRLGYPDEFIRMWEYYFCYCEGGFLERSISAVQLTFDAPGAPTPLHVR